MGRKKELVVDLEALSSRKDATKDKGEYLRLQCLWLRQTRSELTNEEIGQMTGFSKDHVNTLFRNYRQAGDFSFATDKRGGRQYGNLSVPEETAFIDDFAERARSGELVTAGTIKAAYEEKVGHRVPDSTISRLLQRHNWRKVVPYQRHPKANKEGQEAFKKTSQPPYQPH